MEKPIELGVVKRLVRRRSISLHYAPDFHFAKCRCREESALECEFEACPLKGIGVCVRAHYWNHINGAQRPIIDYYSISSSSLDSRQIELDISRTYPENMYFNTDSGSYILRQMLNKISNYLQGLGYVQGMNFIVGALLWHTTELNAFWLFIRLIEEYKLSENFSEGLPGLRKHAEHLECYINEMWPDLFEHLNANDIKTEMFMTDWCITLFTNVIPVNKLGRFFSYFFEEGWRYFYKLTLEILERLKIKILKVEDRVEIITILKPFQLYADNQEKFLKSLTAGHRKTSWSSVLKSAKRRKLMSLR